ncbi:hypothetical protein GCM10023235_00840 [Kitasatospora terrestris]|uniref:Abasic site processing protein n=2 Tax=Kitasatospora terrestris TaxID=258051 RepID=A0ABP9D6Q3_9ACTN
MVAAGELQVTGPSGASFQVQHSRRGGLTTLARLTSCTVITTDATDAAGRIHDRMPLTITAANREAWLDPDHTDPASLRALLPTSSGTELTVTAISTGVDSVHNDRADLLTGVDDPLPA